MKKYLAEFIGTFMLVFVGTGSVVLAKGDALTIGLAFGLTVTVMAYSVGAISGGNFNPAISTALMVNGRLPIKDGIAYIVSQFLGAIAASGIIKWWTTSLGQAGNSLGQTDFPKVNAGTAFVAETLITFIFVLVILLVTSKKYSAGNLAPVAIGLTLGLLIITVLNVTGGSLNPARSFGPAIFAGGDSLGSLLGLSIGAAIRWRPSRLYWARLGNRGRLMGERWNLVAFLSLQLR